MSKINLRKIGAKWGGVCEYMCFYLSHGMLMKCEIVIPSLQANK